MSASTAPPIPLDIAFITGPTMVGICLSWGLAGVMVVQIYNYFEAFPRDPPFVKALVYTLAALDAVQTAMVTADAFHWFVFGFGDMARLDDTFLNSWDVPVLDAIISLVVQAFYCWRIWYLRKSYVIPGAILFVALLQCGAGIATGVRAHQLGKISLIGTEVAQQTIWLVGGAIADVSIAVVLSWTLLHERNGSLASTRGLITRALRLIVETNALTASVAVIALILYWGVPSQPTLVVPPTAIMGKLYTNCLVAVFNSRSKRVDDKQSSHGMQSINLPLPRTPRFSARRSGSSPVSVDGLGGGGGGGGGRVHVVKQIELDNMGVDMGTRPESEADMTSEDIESRKH
ncbi:unnamed protein product [Mycena citricolor]|uniref:DUF6534 domain-containing protein n=1 Tax=Mycena citricolor TaxID=2018698 RepID=A0AAD2HCV1_9AGAR|nr:unnamed protein product [Mycena citricolor]